MRSGGPSTGGAFSSIGRSVPLGSSRTNTHALRAIAAGSRPASALASSMRRLSAVKTARVGDSLTGEQAANDLERVLEARDEVVARETERAELGLVPTGAKRDD